MLGLRRLATWLLAAVLLAGQQVALHHQVWHAGTAVVADSSAPKPSSERNPLCDQHAALGAMLGTIDCAATHAAPSVLAAAAVAAVPFLARDNAPLAPSSRDPPELL
jgi:hypothetical protein